MTSVSTCSFVCLCVLLFVTRWLVLLPIVNMISYALPIILVGSHLSLRRHQTDPNTGKFQTSETISKFDAAVFPLIAATAIIFLYVAFKYLSAYWINLCLCTYLATFGVLAISRTLSALFAHLFGTEWHLPMCSIEFEVPQMFKIIDSSLVGSQKISMSRFDLMTTVIGLLISAGWLVTNDWTLHNVCAICFAVQAIKMLSLKTFRVAVLLLLGLFIYDIVFVFGTDVMVTVARSFSGPAKILFPNNFQPLQFSLLGLGDIILPGIFIAMLLRFDVAGLKWNFPTFRAAWMSYTFGLVMTAVAMKLSGHPQPALLYLVPSCLIGATGSVVWQRRWRDMWEYSEEEEVKEKNE